MMKNSRAKIVLFTAAAVLAALVTAAVYIFWDMNKADVPEQLAITVAWNPHSTADTMVRTLAGVMEPQIMIQNVTGANGARGANAVFHADRDGTNILSTSLSAFVTAEAMGFGESSYRDWAVWLCAFAPAVVTVAADSPYRTMDDLIVDLRGNPGKLKCANGGFGTTGFVAAELFRTRGAFDFHHAPYSGGSPAGNALINGEADFGILLSVEIAGLLRSGELRALGAFGDTDIAPSIVGISSGLDAVLPFGEYYGLFVPVDVPRSRLNGLENLLQAAAASDAFAAFVRNNGLAAQDPGRKQDGELTERFAVLVCWTLYDAEFLPTNPDTLGIGLILSCNNTYLNNPTPSSNALDLRYIVF
jgi:tripartite-type tricarboxylate transporter receptor subunit TctC